MIHRGEVWFAATPVGDRPVLILTRDPVASIIERVVVAELRSTPRQVESELELGPDEGLPRHCVVTFDNLRTIDQKQFRRFIARLDEVTMHRACQRMNMALGC